MNQPRPESRITNLEKEFVELGSRIEEHVSDTAESLNALQQELTANVEVIREDIKGLDDGIKSSFDEIGDAFTLLDSNIEAVKATMATKEDLRQLEARMDNKLTAMKEELIDAMKMLFQQRPSE